MAEADIHFYTYTQTDALRTFLPLLKPHLPFSNALYNRIRAPHNVPSRHCLFAATFPPTPSPSPREGPESPAEYMIVFADRSRHSESQIWIFHPFITQPAPLAIPHRDSLTRYLRALILFLKDIQIPQAPGWPFSPILRFACLHEHFTSTLRAIAEPKEAFVRATHWNCWTIRTYNISTAGKHERRPLPTGFSIVSPVPEDKMDVVLGTATIPRQLPTMLMLPSIGVLDEQGTLAAWSYIGIDGGIITLHVLPDYRQRGMATLVAVELLERLARGSFATMGFDESSGWVHADVKAGNSASEGVMRSLAGEIGWESSYVWIDSAKF